MPERSFAKKHSVRTVRSAADRAATSVVCTIRRYVARVWRVPEQIDGCRISGAHLSRPPETNILMLFGTSSAGVCANAGQTHRFARMCTWSAWSDSFGRHFHPSCGQSATRARRLKMHSYVAVLWAHPLLEALAQRFDALGDGHEVQDLRLVAERRAKSGLTACTSHSAHCCLRKPSPLDPSIAGGPGGLGC